MRLVAVESPYAGAVERNLKYARAAVADCISRGEAPIASHLLFTQPGILKDDVEFERELGIKAGLEWATKADARVAYINFGISSGIKKGILHAKSIGQVVEYRRLASWDDHLESET